MKLTTHISEVSMDQSYKIVNLTIAWCKKNFTPPHIKRRKELLVMVYNSPTDRVYGQYCEQNNWLTINLGVCHNVRDVITTTIHEYTHFCQDLKQYSVMTKKLGYDRNPFEVEARENESYYKKCWKSVKRKL